MEQNEKRILIRGARILNPARGEDYVGNILITGERVSAVSEHVYDDDAVVIEHIIRLFHRVGADDEAAEGAE